MTASEILIAIGLLGLVVLLNPLTVHLLPEWMFEPIGGEQPEDTDE